MKICNEAFLLRSFSADLSLSATTDRSISRMLAVKTLSRALHLFFDYVLNITIAVGPTASAELRKASRGRQGIRHQ